MLQKLPSSLAVFNSRKVLSATLIACGVLAGCSSTSYRCPLNPGDEPESPTACTSMQEALAGAKSGTGGRNSVMTDDGGKLIKEVAAPSSTKQVITNPLVARMAVSHSSAEAFKSAPVFETPKVFQFWTPAQVDSQGVFHEGRQSWMATTGRWRAPGVEGAGYQPSVSARTQPLGEQAGASDLQSSGYALRPSMPSDSLSSKFIPVSKQEVKPAVPAATTAPSTTSNTAAPANTASAASAAAKKEQKSSALSSFSDAVVNSTKKPSNGITAPAVGLTD